MTLLAPFFISSRLMAAVKIGDVTLSINFTDNYTDDNREIWEYYQDFADGRTHHAADINTGCGASSNAQEMMGTLLAFLGACAESRQYATRMGWEKKENASLFPDFVGEWAEANSDEIGMMQYDLEENAGAYVK